MNRDLYYFDVHAGISGDMNLAAFIDIGVPEAYLKKGLNKIKLSGYQLTSKSAIKNGITGTQVHIHMTKEKKEHSHHHKHKEHSHRSWKEIRELIKCSELKQKTQEIAIDIFTRIAKAEAKIHGHTVDNVHFHEIGAVDSIVDIVGTAIAVEYLNYPRFISSSLHLGGGEVQCAHGRFPVPAPATIEILKNIPITIGKVSEETTTPTGAAIVASLAESFTDQITAPITSIAYGIGHKDMDIPNVLRLYKIDRSKSISTKENSESQNKLHCNELLSCNIDDMNGEQLGYLLDSIESSDFVLDYWLIPIQMKKKRPGHLLQALYQITHREQVLELIFEQSSTIGVRIEKIEKIALPRKIKTVKTSLGEVRIKQVNLNSEEIKVKIEWEDIKKIAKEQNLSALTIEKKLYQELRHL